MLPEKNVTITLLTKNEQCFVCGGGFWGEAKKAAKKVGEVANDINQIIDMEARKVGEKARELKDAFIEGREEAKKA